MSDTRLDLLANRIVDGRETPDEFAEFRRLAADRPAAWEALAEMQRDDRALRALASAATGGAERVDLPHAAFAPSPGFAAAAGWLVAAALGLALAVPGGGSARPRDGGPQVASIGPTLSSAEALRTYLDRGRAEGLVLEELEPKALLGSRPLPGGGYELVFVRQILERVEVPAVYRFDARLDGAADGAAIPLPAVLPSGTGRTY